MWYSALLEVVFRRMLLRMSKGESRTLFLRMGMFLSCASWDVDFDDAVLLLQPVPQRVERLEPFQLDGQVGHLLLCMQRMSLLHLCRRT